MRYQPVSVDSYSPGHPHALLSSNRAHTVAATPRPLKTFPATQKERNHILHRFRKDPRMTIYANLQSILRRFLERPNLFCVIVFATAAFSTSAAHAQFRTSIQGTVTDPAGAVIPGATLTLTDTDTNHVLTATSNASGVYNFNALPPDHYNLTVSAKDFKQRVLHDVHLIPEQPNAV